MATYYRLKDFNDETGVRIYVEKWLTIRETERGFWIQQDWSIGHYNERDARKRKLLKWVSKTSVRAHAYPTIEQALNSLQHRKKSQVTRLELQLESAQLVLSKFSTLKGLSAEELSCVKLGATPAHDRYNWDV